MAIRRRSLALVVSLRRGILVLLLLAAAVPGWAQCLSNNYINQLVPSAVPMGGAGFTLTVNGCGFVSGSVVNWNGNALVTTFVNSGQLTAAVPSADIASPGTASITVSSGGTVANAVYFEITGPFIDHLLPSAVPPGGAGFTLTVNGTGFVSGSVVNWNGSALATTFVSNDHLTVEVPSANIASPGTASITVSSIGFVSNVAHLEIANPVPFINQPLVPSAVPPGGAGFTLTVNGIGFVPGSVVNWNGSALATTFVSNDQLTAAVPGADIASPGTASISVSSGGTVSNVAYLQITSTTTSVSFLRTDISAGNGGFSVAAGDFNGDGKLDLVVPDFWTNTVNVLLGNGDGTFKPAVTYVLYLNPDYNALSVALGDFNGDGKLDLAVLTSYDISKPLPIGITGEVTLLLGNGDGTFTLGQGYPVTWPMSLAVGDFNGDGKLDLVVASCAISILFAPDCTKGSVAVMLGNGDGTFQHGPSYPPLVNFAAGSFTSPPFVQIIQPQLLAVGDFNGDGTPDLTVANYGDGTVGVLLGYGDGTFQPMTSYASGLNPSSVVVGDFNGDGKLDLAASDGGANTISVLLGNGDGTFQSVMRYAAGPYSHSLTMGDFNGDGKLDLAVANMNCAYVFYQCPNGTVSLLLGNGDGTFSAPVNSTVAIVPGSVAAGDFNGDGRLDLAVANTTSSLSLLIQPTRTNQPPIANAGGPYVAEATSPAGASVTLDGSLSSDPDGDALSYTWSGPFGTLSGARVTATLPLGTSTVMLTVDDGHGNTAQASTSVSVVDTTPPVLTVPGNITVRASSASGAVVTYTASAYDTVSGTLPVTCSPPSGSTFPIGVSTVSCTAVDQAGNASSGSFSVTVSQATQTITFAALPNRTYGNADFAVAATASSGLAVSFTVGATDNCTISGSTVHITGAGNCTVTAHQSGNATYSAAADVPQSFTISQATSSVVLTCPTTPQNYTGSAQTPCTASYTTSDALSGALTVSYTNNINVGTAGASASYVGDANHAGSSKSGSFTISQATSSVVLTCPTTPQTYTGSAQTPCTASYTTSDALSGALTVSYTNNINVGAAGASASYVGDTNHAGSSKSGSFTIVKANQTITLTGVPSSALFGQGPFTLSASATSALPVTLSASGNCSISSSSLSLTGIGTCTVTALQGGNSNYNAAPTLNPSFTIGQAPTTTNASVSPGTVQYSDYTTLTATVTPISAGGQSVAGTVQFSLNGANVGSPVAINASGVATLPQVQVNLAAGSYPVQAVFSSTNANFVGSPGTTLQMVTQENAFILYSGDTIAQVGTALNLRATVWDSAAAGYPGVNPESGATATIGDITKMWIAFDIYPAGSCGSGTPSSTWYAHVALTGTPGIGTATAGLSSPSEVSYCVVSRLVVGNTGGTNLFYAAPNAQAAGLDFYVNRGQFATGGGWVNDPSGSHGNFGFNARYNSTGSPKGQMVYVYRALYNGVLADFIIKSNALTALQFTGTTYPISSTLQGKMNVQVNRASDGLALFSAGNYTFSATVTDSGQNGNVGKQFSLIVYDSNGVPYHNVPAATPLQGGNVVVHLQ